MQFALQLIILNMLFFHDKTLLLKLYYKGRIGKFIFVPLLHNAQELKVKRTNDSYNIEGSDTVEVCVSTHSKIKL